MQNRLIIDATFAGRYGNASYTGGELFFIVVILEYMKTRAVL